MKDATYRRIAATVVALAVLAAVGFAVSGDEASAFGPKRGGENGWFGPDIQLSETQRQEIAKIHGAGGPMGNQRDMDRVLEKLGETPDAKAIADAKEEIAGRFYEGMKMRYQEWWVLSEEQRRTIEMHRQSDPAGRGQKSMLDQEALVRYVDKICDLSPAQEKALASQKQEDFRKDMAQERFVLLGKKLKLTEDQEKKLTALFEKAGKQVDHKDGIGHGACFEEDAQLMNAPIFDEKLAHKIAEDNAEEMVSGYMARQKLHQYVFDILTDAQEKQLEEFGGPGADGGEPFHRGW